MEKANKDPGNISVPHNIQQLSFARCTKATEDGRRKMEC